MFCYQIKFVVDTDNDNDVVSLFSQFLKICVTLELRSCLHETKNYVN